MRDLWNGIVTMAHHPVELGYLVFVIVAVGALLVLFDAILRGAARGDGR